MIGVTVAPAHQETIHARLDSDAWLNGNPVRGAETQTPAQAIMEIGRYRRRPKEDFLKVCARVLSDKAGLRHLGSGALGLADVAIGRQDGYAETPINPWDLAAAW